MPWVLSWLITVIWYLFQVFGLKRPLGGAGIQSVVGRRPSRRRDFPGWEEAAARIPEKKMAAPPWHPGRPQAQDLGRTKTTPPTHGE